MTRKEMICMIALAVVFGFLGGAVSHRLLGGESVFAQEEPTEIVKAQEFQLVDKEGKVLGRFGTSLRGTMSGGLMLYDAHGRLVWAAPQAARMHPLHNGPSGE